MCYDDFFTNPEMQLPLTRKHTDFLFFVENLFNSYNQQIEAYGSSISVPGHRLCEDILNLLKAYFNGHPNRAYETLSAALVGDLKEWLQMSFDLKTSGTDGVRLYRMRTEKETVFDRRDIFHVPYEKRHIISTQRYSIPGLPCLYLGGSVYTCWLELGCPRLEDVSVAAFHLAEGQNVKFLRFDVNPQWVIENDVNDVFKESYIKYWPLFAACSIRDLVPKAHFKPEYIVPQLLLQWVTQNSDFDGIKFFSTNIKKITTNPHWCCNYVFPASVNCSNGFCSKLNRKFILTEPYYWKLLSTCNIEIGTFYDELLMEIIPGKAENYYFTEFGEVQMNLDCLLRDVRREHQNNPNFGRVDNVL
ncbi:MAG: hypothetical protein LLF76_11080 [Planctomycetaceae bacterium]|nr:hypothetical protein [Planctomycetaceae bacterium]